LHANFLIEHRRPRGDAQPLRAQATGAPVRVEKRARLTLQITAARIRADAAFCVWLLPSADWPCSEMSQGSERAGTSSDDALSTVA
jgi:hypothetical protein